MVDSNDSFLREIKEEMDREKVANFWNNYGALVIGAGAAVIVAVAGYQIWTSMERRAAQEAGAVYEAALDQVFAEKLDDASTKFSQLEKSGPAGYGLLAGLQVAATLAENGKTAEAVAEFEKMANRDGGDELIRGFARLQAAALRLGDADFKEMQNRLEPLIKEDAPWQFNAQELLAVAAVKAGKTDVAKQAFEKILSEPDLPPAMRQRANLRLLQIAANEGAPTAAQPAEKTDSGEAGAAKAEGPAEDKAAGEAAKGAENSGAAEK